MGHETILKAAAVEDVTVHAFSVNGTRPAWEELRQLAGEKGFIDVEIAFYSDSHRRLFGAEGEGTQGTVRISDEESYGVVLDSVKHVSACKPRVLVTI
jgi:hypothetical protein